MTEDLKKFLVAGVDAYAPGFRAMARFRREVLLGVRRAMAGNLDRLGTATGLALKVGDIRPYAYPDGLAEEDEEWDYLVTSVGAKITVPDRTHIFAEIFWYLDESSDEAKSAVSVTFEPWYAPYRREILAMAQSGKEAVFEENPYVWLQEEVSSANISDFENLLNSIFARWRAIFEKNGGFPTQRAR